MAARYRFLLILSILLSVFSQASIAQEKEKYILTPAPDIWYNDVDGIRLGVRLKGEMDGTFNDGPHRLDFGIWGGLWIPDHPISYYTSFTEPIKGLSDFGNEASIQAISSVRTGYSQHRLQLNKRWQPGFDEYNYKELAVYFSQEKLFEPEYRPFDILWQEDWKSLFGLNFLMSFPQESGYFVGIIDLKTNVNDQSGTFSVGTLELKQRFDLNDRFKLRIRGFVGLSSENTVPEFRFMNSMSSAQNWLGSGISRAKGTIPMPWMESGSFQIVGGANLRGYLNREIQLLTSGGDPTAESVISLNNEFEFPNPVKRHLQGISIIGDLIDFRSYLFFDIGRQDFVSPTTTVGNVSSNTPVLADAGTGFQLSINIPDYLGKDRGIFIRYDIPFWLSDPDEGDNNFKYRNVIGVGAIFPF